MVAVQSEAHAEPWRRRLYLPTYQIGEAARYAQISPQTVAAWHKDGARAGATLSEKDKGAALSYLQLIEVAVVAAFRKTGVSLSRIRRAREYVSTVLQSEFPFSEYRFKTDGKHLFLDYEQIAGEEKRGTLLGADQAGQLAWQEILGRLREFEYEPGGGIAIRWKLAGGANPIVIDPRISFGAPSVDGTPTWIIRGRYEAGESDSEIADDFGLSVPQVRKALRFEGALGGGKRSRRLLH
jgi:uncharacterized protein (DUF433 family)